MDEAFPGTTPWERLGVGNQGSGIVSSAMNNAAAIRMNKESIRSQNMMGMGNLMMQKYISDSQRDIEQQRVDIEREMMPWRMAQNVGSAIGSGIGGGAGPFLRRSSKPSIGRNFIPKRNSMGVGNMFSRMGTLVRGVPLGLLGLLSLQGDAHPAVMAKQKAENAKRNESKIKISPKDSRYKAK